MGGTAQISSNVDVSYVQDQLIAGDTQIVSFNISLKGGQGLLKRGTILAKDETGLYVVAKKSSETVLKSIVVLADRFDTADGNTTGAAYFKGEFNAHRIIMDDSWTLDALQDEARPFSIFFKDVVNADIPT